MVNWSGAEVCRKTNRKVRQAVWIHAIALCLIAVRCNGNYFKGPSNTEVAEGSPATLYCETSSSNGVWWRYSNKDIFYAKTISFDYKNSHEAKESFSNGIYSYNLIIRNASSHPGEYTCVDDDGGGERGSAWLTVKANANAMETSSNPPAGGSTDKIVAIAVTLGLVGLAIVIALVIFFKRRRNSSKRNAGEKNPQVTIAAEEAAEAAEAEEAEDVRLLKLDIIQSNETHQDPASSTSTDVGETEPATTINDVASNLQAASSVLNPQKDRVSEPVGLPKEPSPPEVKQESRTENVSPNESESTLSESIDTKYNKFDELMKKFNQQGETPKVPTKQPNKKADEPPVEIKKYSQKNDAIVSQGKQDPVAKPRMSKEPEKLPASSPEETKEPENVNVNTTKGTIESTKKTDNTNADLLKLDTNKDKTPKVLPKQAEMTKAEEPIVEQRENSQKNEADVSQGKQVTNEKPPIPTKPDNLLTRNPTKERTEITTKNEKCDSNPEQNEEDPKQNEKDPKQNEKDLKQNEKDTEQNDKDLKQNEKDLKQNEKDTEQNEKDSKQNEKDSGQKEKDLKQNEEGTPQ